MQYYQAPVHLYQTECCTKRLELVTCKPLLQSERRWKVMNLQVMNLSIPTLESVPRRGMVTGPRRSGDVPVVDHPPPGSTRFVVTRVLLPEALQLAEDRPFWRTIATAGGFGWSLCVTTTTTLLACYKVHASNHPFTACCLVSYSQLIVSTKHT